jgi:hypothetical protein
MLFYDQVLEHAERRLRNMGPDKFGSRNHENLAALRAAAAYEISSVATLTDDWPREKDKAVPKRPPYDPVWAEWRVRNPFQNDRFYEEWTFGALIWSFPEETRKRLVERPPVCANGGAGLAAELTADKEHYAVQFFKRLDAFRHDPDEYRALFHEESLSFEEVEQISRERLKIPTCEPDAFIWSQYPDGSGVHGFSCTPQAREGAGELEAAKLETVFFLEHAHWQMADPWPAFFAFALLNCKNVVTEDVPPDERLQRECRKHKRPPRVTYKVLKVEVPKSAHSRQSYDHAEDDDTGPKVRFHLCSGHFKHLQSERYVNKRGQWIWCPAHGRGSKELGEVKKTYRLTPNQQGGSPATSG